MCRIRQYSRVGPTDAALGAAELMFIAVDDEEDVAAAAAPAPAVEPCGRLKPGKVVLI